MMTLKLLFPLILSFCCFNATGCAVVPRQLPQSISFRGDYVESPDGRRHGMSGDATWYGKKFQGRKTASGERFDVRKMTAAHKTLPFGTVVRVLDLQTGATVEVKINDRGPYGRGRIIDLSEGAAIKLGIKKRGVVPVQLSIISWKK